MRKLLIAALLLSVSGCASVPDVLPKSEGAVIFDSCKAADGISTAIAVRTMGFKELNPLLKGIAGGSMSWYPFAGVITVLILGYNWLDNNGYIGTGPAIAANGITCAVAGRNIWLMLK